jgi:Mn2+/Fe2+ NRAMP family transporter
MAANSGARPSILRDPIKALFWSAVINGVVAVPVMAVMILMGRNRKIMGEFVLGGWLLTVGWLATAVMAACVFGMAATIIAGE